MDFYPKNKIPVSGVKKFIVQFYIVGVLGFAIPFTRDWFVIITPFALLLNLYLLAVYHKEYSLKNILLFLSIFLMGYGIEVVGVSTGLVFGHYSYGNALGFKLFDTPLMIGVNWLFLTYTALAITEDLKLNKWLAVVIAPMFMLVYDIVIERVAPQMNMWSWANSTVPMQNYIAWFSIALCFVVLLKVFKVETKNPLATILFICQIVFFTVLIFLLQT